MEERKEKILRPEGLPLWKSASSLRRGHANLPSIVPIFCPSLRSGYLTLRTFATRRHKRVELESQVSKRAPVFSGSRSRSLLIFNQLDVPVFHDNTRIIDALLPVDEASWKTREIREAPGKRDEDKDEEPQCARLQIMRVVVCYIVIGMEPN